MIYPAKPKGFQPVIDIVGCFVESKNELLLLERLGHKSHGGKWGIPTGKVDPEENTTSAMLRELFEETGISAQKKDLIFFRSIHVRHENDFVFHMYHLRLPKKISIKISGAEHEKYAWASTKDALEYPLVTDAAECIKMFFPN